MPVSIRCGIGTPGEACHSIRIDIEPCIAGIVVSGGNVGVDRYAELLAAGPR